MVVSIQRKRLPAYLSARLCRAPLSQMDRAVINMVAVVDEKCLAVRSLDLLSAVCDPTRVKRG